MKNLIQHPLSHKSRTVCKFYCTCILNNKHCTGTERGHKCLKIYRDVWMIAVRSDRPRGELSQNDMQVFYTVSIPQ